MGTQHNRYAEVVIDTPVQDLDRPFHYSVPEDLRETVEIGSLVLVPFSGRLSLAYVVGFPATPDVSNLKEISRVVDEPPLFDFDSQRLCRWIAGHYLCSLSQAFRLVIPPGRSRRVKQLVELSCGRAEAEGALAARDDSLKSAFEAVSEAGGSLEMSALKARIGAAPAGTAVASLEELGIARRRFFLTEPAASAKGRLAVTLLDCGPGTDLSTLPARQLDIVDHLLAKGGFEFQSSLLAETGTSPSSLKSLAAKGVVEIASAETLRKPRVTSGEPAPGAHTPNERQASAIGRISETADAGLHGVFLLEGVTGSGKTEVYLRCIERVMAAGRGAIVLVPEISLTPQTLERFEARFPGGVAVLHSRLGAGERFDQWRGIRDGRYRVVVGARSALFAPVADLGIIVIDEEHEPSYKSDKAPRYHAREVAEVRARMAGAVLVLGSATPSFESLERARAGHYVRLPLPERIDNRPLPDVEVVDMRDAGGAGVVPLVSQPLLDALSRTIESGDQAILFLNRRGFANYLQCPACGNIPGCDECEVSLCYHARSGSPEQGRKGSPLRGVLMCHHCSKRWKPPEKCPECGGGPLRTFGAGTQRVEQEVRKHLPGVPLIRMDADTTRTKDAHWRLLGAFRAKEAQILIGTQMIAKGLDIPGVTLVGVVNADTALALPDFRASERTYQLLTQVSGRAGRGLRPGRVVVQTFNPAHPAVAALSEGIDTFIDGELATRRHAMYPPFAQLVNVLITSTSAGAAARSAERMRKLLEADLAHRRATILGPAPCPISRLRGSYRWHILIKCGDIDSVSQGLKDSVARFYDYAKAFPAGAAVQGRTRR